MSPPTLSPGGEGTHTPPFSVSVWGGEVSGPGVCGWGESVLATLIEAISRSFNHNLCTQFSPNNPRGVRGGGSKMEVWGGGE